MEKGIIEGTTPAARERQAKDCKICCSKVSNLVNFGFFPHFSWGHFQKIGITALPLKIKPRRVEKFGECRSTYVGESE